MFLVTTIEYLDLGLKIITVSFAGFAAWKAYTEFQLSRVQRRDDLLWKQAEAAKKLIDEWMTDEEAFAFCKMIEYEGRTFKNENEDPFVVNNKLIIAALNDEKENMHTRGEVNLRYIRDCLDSFLYYTELAQQGIENKLYLLRNLKFPLRYYLSKLQKVNLYETVVEYAKENGYKDSIALFRAVLKTDVK